MATIRVDVQPINAFPLLSRIFSVATSKIVNSMHGNFLSFFPFEMMSLGLLFKRAEPGALKTYGVPAQTSSAKILEVTTMEKIKSIRKGSIWLNVFKTDDSQILATVKKTFLNKDGQWNQTQFLNARRGDILDLMDALQEFHELEKMIEARGL